MVSVHELVIEAGYDSLAEALEEWMDAGSVPALCHHECLVEPDGVCEHGAKSVLLEAGLV